MWLLLFTRGGLGGADRVDEGGGSFVDTCVGVVIGFAGSPDARGRLLIIRGLYDRMCARPSVLGGVET